MKDNKKRKALRRVLTLRLFVHIPQTGNLVAAGSLRNTYPSRRWARRSATRRPTQTRGLGGERLQPGNGQRGRRHDEMEQRLCRLPRKARIP